MPSFRPSKLGTKEHWDSVYNEEIQNFEEAGDEGEVWFGEDCMEKMVNWVISNASPPRSLLEIGSGNGVLLCELAKNGYDPSQLAGVDYSPGSIALSQRVACSRGVEGIRFQLCDFLTDEPPIPNIHDVASFWDILLDKGTFDAIGLSGKDLFGVPLMDVYPKRVSTLLKTNGFFLITSCNFTEDELKERFATDETGLRYHSRIQHKTYEYGGKSGSVCSSVAFLKLAPENFNNLEMKRL